VPFELQTIPVGQPPFIEPQFTVPPQPFGAVPHVRVPQAAAAAIGVQPHTLAVPPPPQVCGDAHAPQVTVPVHPSDTEPQFFPVQATVAVFGVQPHTLAVPPPPHVCGDVHVVVHVTCCPQLLAIVPQWVPHVWATVSGRQPQTPFTPPPPQLSPVPAQVVEHITVCMQLLTVGPHLPPPQVTVIASSVHALH
jgi:hypothetical protein